MYVVNKIGNVTFDHILTAACADAQYQDLLHIITIGFPKRHNETEPAHLREFWEVHHQRCCSPRSKSDHSLFTEKCDLEQPSLSQPRCYRYAISCKSMCVLAWPWFQYLKPLGYVPWLHQKCPITTTRATNTNTLTHIPVWASLCWLFSHQTLFISHHCWQVQWMDLHLLFQSQHSQQCNPTEHLWGPVCDLWSLWGNELRWGPTVHIKQFSGFSQTMGSQLEAVICSLSLV